MTSKVDLKITKTQINQFLENLNHRMTKIETDVTWIKRILYYLAGAISISIGKTIFFS